MSLLSFIFYVPESHLEKVKDAIFAAGAGKIGNYDSCSWQTKGVGQFRPLENSQPHLGKIGKVEAVVEWKVEVVCEKTRIHDVLAAFQKAHPYETPAYMIFESYRPGSKG